MNGDQEQQEDEFVLEYFLRATQQQHHEQENTSAKQLLLRLQCQSIIAPLCSNLCKMANKKQLLQQFCDLYLKKNTAAQQQQNAKAEVFLNAISQHPELYRIGVHIRSQMLAKQQEQVNQMVQHLLSYFPASDNKIAVMDNDMLRNGKEEDVLVATLVKYMNGITSITEHVQSSVQAFLLTFACMVRQLRTGPITPRMVAHVRLRMTDVVHVCSGFLMEKRIATSIKHVHEGTMERAFCGVIPFAHSSDKYPKIESPSKGRIHATLQIVPLNANASMNDLAQQVKNTDIVQENELVLRKMSPLHPLHKRTDVMDLFDRHSQTMEQQQLVESRKELNYLSGTAEELQFAVVKVIAASQLQDVDEPEDVLLCIKWNQQLYDHLHRISMDSSIFFNPFKELLQNAPKLNELHQLIDKVMNACMTVLKSVVHESSVQNMPTQLPIPIDQLRQIFAQLRDDHLLLDRPKMVNPKHPFAAQLYEHHTKERILGKQLPLVVSVENFKDDFLKSYLKSPENVIDNDVWTNQDVFNVLKQHASNLIPHQHLILQEQSAMEQLLVRAQEKYPELIKEARYYMSNPQLILAYERDVQRGVLLDVMSLILNHEFTLNGITTSPESKPLIAAQEVGKTISAIITNWKLTSEYQDVAYQVLSPQNSVPNKPSESKKSDETLEYESALALRWKMKRNDRIETVLAAKDDLLVAFKEALLQNTSSNRLQYLLQSEDEVNVNSVASQFDVGPSFAKFIDPSLQTKNPKLLNSYFEEIFPALNLAFSIRKQQQASNFLQVRYIMEARVRTAKYLRSKIPHLLKICRGEIKGEDVTSLVDICRAFCTADDQFEPNMQSNTFELSHDEMTLWKIILENKVDAHSNDMNQDIVAYLSRALDRKIRVELPSSLRNLMIILTMNSAYFVHCKLLVQLILKLTGYMNTNHLLQLIVQRIYLQLDIEVKETNQQPEQQLIWIFHQTEESWKPSTAFKHVLEMANQVIPILYKQCSVKTRDDLFHMLMLVCKCGIRYNVKYAFAMMQSLCTHVTRVLASNLNESHNCSLLIPNMIRIARAIETPSSTSTTFSNMYNMMIYLSQKWLRLYSSAGMNNETPEPPNHPLVILASIIRQYASIAPKCELKAEYAEQAVYLESLRMKYFELQPIFKSSVQHAVIEAPFLAKQQIEHTLLLCHVVLGIFQTNLVDPLIQDLLHVCKEYIARWCEVIEFNSMSFAEQVHPMWFIKCFKMLSHEPQHSLGMAARSTLELLDELARFVFKNKALFPKNYVVNVFMMLLARVVETCTSKMQDFTPLLMPTLIQLYSWSYFQNKYLPLYKNSTQEDKSASMWNQLHFMDAASTVTAPTSNSKQKEAVTFEHHTLEQIFQLYLSHCLTGTNEIAAVRTLIDFSQQITLLLNTNPTSVHLPQLLRKYLYVASHFDELHDGVPTIQALIDHLLYTNDHRCYYLLLDVKYRQKVLKIDQSTLAILHEAHDAYCRYDIQSIELVKPFVPLPISLQTSHEEHTKHQMFVMVQELQIKSPCPVALYGDFVYLFKPFMDVVLYDKKESLTPLVALLQEEATHVVLVAPFSKEEIIWSILNYCSLPMTRTCVEQRARSRLVDDQVLQHAVLEFTNFLNLSQQVTKIASIEQWIRIVHHTLRNRMNFEICKDEKPEKQDLEQELLFKCMEFSMQLSNSSQELGNLLQNHLNNESIREITAMITSLRSTNPIQSLSMIAILLLKLQQLVNKIQIAYKYATELHDFLNWMSNPNQQTLHFHFSPSLNENLSYPSEYSPLYYAFQSKPYFQKRLPVYVRRLIRHLHVICNQHGLLSKSNENLSTIHTIFFASLHGMSILQVKQFQFTKHHMQAIQYLNDSQNNMFHLMLHSLLSQSFYSHELFPEMMKQKRLILQAMQFLKDLKLEFPALLQPILEWKFEKNGKLQTDVTTTLFFDEQSKVVQQLHLLEEQAHDFWQIWNQLNHEMLPSLPIHETQLDKCKVFGLLYSSFGTNTVCELFELALDDKYVPWHPITIKLQKNKQYTAFAKRFAKLPNQMDMKWMQILVHFAFPKLHSKLFKQEGMNMSELQIEYDRWKLWTRDVHLYQTGNLILVDQALERQAKRVLSKNQLSLRMFLQLHQWKWSLHCERLRHNPIVVRTMNNGAIFDTAMSHQLFTTQQGYLPVQNELVRVDVMDKFSEQLYLMINGNRKEMEVPSSIQLSEKEANMLCDLLFHGTLQSPVQVTSDNTKISEPVAAMDASTLKLSAFVIQLVKYHCANYIFDKRNYLLHDSAISFILPLAYKICSHSPANLSLATALLYACAKTCKQLDSCLQTICMCIVKFACLHGANTSLQDLYHLCTCVLYMAHGLVQEHVYLHHLQHVQAEEIQPLVMQPLPVSTTIQQLLKYILICMQQNTLPLHAALVQAIICVLQE